MSLNATEKSACQSLVQSIKNDYLSGKLTGNEMGLTGRDLNVVQSKWKDVIYYLRGLPAEQLRVSGSPGKNATVITIYVVGNTKKNLVKMDLTGHELKYDSGGVNFEDKTITKGQGKAGAALFNVHVNFTGVDETTKQLQKQHLEQAKETKKTFEAKQKAEAESKVKKTYVNAFAMLADGDGDETESEES